MPNTGVHSAASPRCQTIGLCFRLAGNKGARRRQPAPRQSARMPSVHCKGRWRQTLGPDCGVSLGLGPENSDRRAATPDSAKEGPREATMTYQMFRRRSNFCRCTVEAWVQVGVMCESHTFYGNNDEIVRAQAMRWIKERHLRAA
jgi:hypothetical protein